MNFVEFLKRLFGREVPTRSPKAPEPLPTPVVQPDTSAHRAMFDKMQIRAEWRGRVNWCVEKILSGRLRYEALERETGVPWYMIGVIHLLEGACNFKTHLHNGDPLTARTVRVPAGRPKVGTPPFAWEESARDALAYDKIAPPLETIGQQFEALERYNGLGYRSKGHKTPYLWSGSDQYVRGKYVRDGVYDPLAVSDQVGAACVYKVLVERGILKI